MRILTLFLTLALAVTASAQNRLNYGTLNWSDDGRQILFSAIEVKPDWSNYSEFNWRLYLYDLKREELTLVDRAAQYGAFSPDGDKVIYSKNTGYSWDLYIKDLSSGAKRKVTDTPQHETAPDWSPDGRMIIFTRKLKKDVSGIYSMDTEGRNVRNLSRNDRFECHNPEFSPDGEMVVYYMDKGDKRDQVYVMELRTGFARNVTRDNQNNIFPSWFDGQYLLYARGKNELCLKDVQGGTALPIEGIESYFAKYNTAQKQLAYINREDQSIYIQKLKGGPGRLKASRAERVVSPEIVRGK